MRLNIDTVIDFVCQKTDYNVDEDRRERVTFVWSDGVFFVRWAGEVLMVVGWGPPLTNPKMEVRVAK